MFMPGGFTARSDRSMRATLSSDRKARKRFSCARSSFLSCSPARTHVMGPPSPSSPLR